MQINNKYGDKPKCKECGKVYACTGGSTKGLHDHLLSMHAIDIRARKRPADADADSSELSSGTSSSQIQVKKKCGPMSKFLTHNVENSLL